MISAQLMLAFDGPELPAAVAERMRTGRRPAFRCSAARTCARPSRSARWPPRCRPPRRQAARPLLIAADQETGQLVGLGDDLTPFAGAMALGATSDVSARRRSRPRHCARDARAGCQRRLRAGVRPGHQPGTIRRSASARSAMIRSPSATWPRRRCAACKSERVAATAKHFPGQWRGHRRHPSRPGAVVDADRSTLRPCASWCPSARRWRPAPGWSCPATSRCRADRRRMTCPAASSAEVVGGLLRHELGFDGLAITDALDMHAIAQGAAQVVDVICAVRAGQDLLLATPDAALVARLDEGLAQAERRGLIDARPAMHRAPASPDCAPGWPKPVRSPAWRGRLPRAPRSRRAAGSAIP